MVWFSGLNKETLIKSPTLKRAISWSLKFGNIVLRYVVVGIEKKRRKKCEILPETRQACIKLVNVCVVLSV